MAIQWARSTDLAKPLLTGRNSKPRHQHRVFLPPPLPFRHNLLVRHTCFLCACFLSCFFLDCRPHQQSGHKAREPNPQISHGELMRRALPGRMSSHRPQQMRARFNSIVQGKISKHIPTGADYCSRGEIFHRIFSEENGCRQNGFKYFLISLP